MCVQDVEDQADSSLHKASVCQVAQLTETDSFWFFSLEQTGAVLNEAPAEKTNTPSNFLLFLPDRKYAPQIGHLGQDEFPVAEPEPSKDDHKDESKPLASDLSLLNPDVVVAEVLQEIKDQTEEKKVTFAEEPEIEDSPKKRRVRTVYYGRDRSKSRNRLKDVETGSKRRSRVRDSSVSEVEVMRNLARSVDEANNILMRRREDDRVTFSPSPERYSGMMSPRLETRSEERFARRSRDEARNKAENERRERSRRTNSNLGGENDVNVPNQPGPSSSSGASSAQVDSPQGGKGLKGGIMSFASNLMGGGKSRREQSDTRARGLLRKSARNFL